MRRACSTAPTHVRLGPEAGRRGRRRRPAAQPQRLRCGIVPQDVDQAAVGAAFEQAQRGGGGGEQVPQTGRLALAAPLGLDAGRDVVLDPDHMRRLPRLVGDGRQVELVVERLPALLVVAEHHPLDPLPAGGRVADPVERLALASTVVVAHAVADLEEPAVAADHLVRVVAGEPEEPLVGVDDGLVGPAEVRDHDRVVGRVDRPGEQVHVDPAGGDRRRAHQDQQAPSVPRLRSGLDLDRPRRAL